MNAHDKKAPLNAKSCGCIAAVFFVLAFFILLLSFMVEGFIGVAGFVVDQNLNPIANATVEIYEPPNGAPFKTLKTDSSGGYEHVDSTAGIWMKDTKFRVVISLDGHHSLTIETGYDDYLTPGVHRLEPLESGLPSEANIETERSDSPPLQ